MILGLDIFYLIIEQKIRVQKMDILLHLNCLHIGSVDPLPPGTHGPHQYHNRKAKGLLHHLLKIFRLIL